MYEPTFILVHFCANFVYYTLKTFSVKKNAIRLFSYSSQYPSDHRTLFQVLD